MFKSIQKYLLLRHPLLWNTKIVPAIVFALLFHLIFFVLGYSNGAIDFTSEDRYPSNFDDGVIIFFSVLVTILFFVLWFVYYFRNNAYKSFYPLRNAALYKEWLIIFLVCFLNTTYSVTYTFGKRLKERSYYTKEETMQRCETIVLASVFIEGTLQNEGPKVNKVVFNHQYYPTTSLMNKDLDYFNYEHIVSYEIKVKTWMQEDNQQAIKKLMSDYFALVKEHHLKSNITPEQWFDLTYHYPDFTTYEIIGKTMMKGDATDSNGVVYAYANDTHYKYNVPQAALQSSYNILYKAWGQPIIEDGLCLVLLYLSLALSMLVFAFRVTSGRNWLIALVSSGVLFIVTGILSALTNSGLTFQIFWLLAILAFMTYFFVTVIGNKGKSLSGVFLNLLLWSLTGFMPLVYALLQQYFNKPVTYFQGGYQKMRNTPEYNWLQEHETAFAWFNILFMIVLMWFICRYIKQWKGLAES